MTGESDTEGRAKERIQVSAAGLKNIPIHENLNDFEFMVGSRAYKCHRFVADFLSPKIGDMHTLDPTMDHYLIETPDTNEQFGLFLLLGRGEGLDIRERDLQFFCSLCRELGNVELCSHIHQHFEKKPTLENCAEMLTLCHLTNEGLETIVDFCALHFHELSHEVLIQFQLDDLYAILSHSKLKLKSEDALFNHIWELKSTDLSYLTLLEFVRFEFLSVECMQKLCESEVNFLAVLKTQILAANNESTCV
jgi:hypothetical protein